MELSDTALDYVDLAAHSPLPAWAMTGLLLYAGFSAPQALASKAGSGGSYQFSKSLALAKPTRKSSLLFGAANALGGWIIFDGDVTNGAGFTFAWSCLYLLVNGGPSVKSLLHGRVSPVAISTLALGNAGIYGKQFFWPRLRPTV